MRDELHSSVQLSFKTIELTNAVQWDVRSHNVINYVTQNHTSTARLAPRPIIHFCLSTFHNFSEMTVKEQVVHDRVNLVRLVRRLDKSVNEAAWGTGRSWTLWLESERVLQVGPLFSETPTPLSCVALNVKLVATETCPKVAGKRRARQ